jgi:hypothetical protein
MHDLIWYKERQKGIGGSDAPVIMNGSHYGRTVQDLFIEKTAPEPVITEETSAMHDGTLLEPIIRQAIENIHNVKLVEQLNRTNPDAPFMRCNCDGFDEEKRWLYEFKATAHPERSKQLYFWQVCHCAAIFKPNKNFLVSLDKNILKQYNLSVEEVVANYADSQFIQGAVRKSLKIEELKFEEGDYNLLIEKERKFWQCVETCTMPETLDINCANKMDYAVVQAQKAKKISEWAEGIEKQYKEAAYQLCGDKKKIETGSYSISFVETAAKPKFNLELFEKEHPDLFRKYCITSENGNGNGYYRISARKPLKEHINGWFESIALETVSENILLKGII